MMRLTDVLIASAGLAVAFAQTGATADPKEWPTYGHDAGGMRFSPLTQITPANVSQLKVAWVYHMKPEGAVANPGRVAGEAYSLASRPARLRPWSSMA